MNKLFKIFTALVLLLVLSQCKKDEEPISSPNYWIRLLVLNEVTGLPISGAQLQLLEGGASVTTQTDGKAVFNQNNLKAVKAEITDSTAFSVSIQHPDFLPRELTVALGESTVKMTPRPVVKDPDTLNYSYKMPDLLSDGLEVANWNDVGLDTLKIQQLMEKIEIQGYKQLHSILIYKGGRLVLEEYYFGNNDTINFEGGVIRDKSPAPIQWTREDKHYIASVNKALTSTLTGIALEKKGLTTDALLKDYLPEYAGYFENDSKKAGVTFHHALNMTLGFQWDEWGSNDLVQLWKSDDFADFLFNRTNKGPGSEWFYNSASPNVILKGLENMVGEPIREWAHTNFYERLGITDYKWQNQPGGYPEGAARMYMRPRDMLKVGITYLNNGKWNGEQVIPASWVEKCMNVQEITNAGNYSHFFWIRELKGVTYLSADGDGGNYINIFPDQDMVIVMTQGNYLEHPLYVNQANDMMGNYILPAIK